LPPGLSLQLNLPEGTYACVSVQDDGCGMDAATQARAFEPFFTTKQVGQGSGLGLSMVYGFARQSGGAVTIDSEPGNGTTITLWLPMPNEWEPEVVSDASPPVPESLHEGPPHGLALLVEDDASVRKVVRRQLLDLGYAVLEASNGEEAMGILAQTQGLKVVLSDFVMPGGVDGRQVTTHALQRGDIPRVLLMSGYPPEADQPAQVPLIQKPFTLAQLAAALQASPH
jgi:CheY-like chemotaxis protein